MTAAGEPDRFEEQRAQQRRRAALHTTGDTWRTAAVMTCLLTPLGFLFGVVALVVMRGLYASIETGDEPRAQQKLRRGRTIVLVGTAAGAASLLVGLFSMMSLLRQVSNSFDQVRELPELRPEAPPQ